MNSFKYKCTERHAYGILDVRAFKGTNSLQGATKKYRLTFNAITNMQYKG